MRKTTMLDKNSTIDYYDAIGKLMDGIKKDYANWGGNSMDDITPQQRDIRLKMIDEFNKGLDIKSGKKYDKVIQGGSVWGFIAKDDGVHKGIPHKKGDVFKAAGWRAPAKWARGSIFDDNQSWFHWTGPNYII